MARKLKHRPTYRQHETALIDTVIRAAIPREGIFIDYLDEIVQERVDATTEYERGVIEGRRRFAGELISIALSEKEADATT